MRISKLLNICVLGAALSLLAGCSEPSTYHDVNVKTFTFKTSTLAPDLKGIAFTVDTIQNIIYNLDSVSYTSDITKVVPVVTCYSTPSEIRINDNYWNQVDSLNVTAPFKLTVVGADKSTTRSFTVTVNKHTVDQDKISWTALTPTGLDKDFTAGRAVYRWNKILLVGEAAGSQYCYSSPDAVTWSFVKSVDNDIDLRTLYSPEGDSAPDSLFALSADKSKLIAITPEQIECVIALPDGVQGVDIIGEEKSGKMIILANQSGTPKLFSFKKGNVEALSGSLPQGFPVDGYSAKCNAHLDAPVVKNVIASFVIGGKCDGTDYVRNAFSSDNGWYWTSVIKTPIDKYGFEGLNSSTVVRYDRRLFIYGGKTAAGITNPAYVSSDTGFTWAVSDDSERLPESSVLAYDISVIRDTNDGYMYAVCGWDVNGTFRIQCFRGRAIHKDFIRK